MELGFDLTALQTPCYVVDEGRLEENLKQLKAVSDATGCKILLAQKAFSMFYFYPLIGRYLAGTTASGLYEARLGKEEMGGETHIFSPAYQQRDFAEILSYSDHLVFNSLAQWESFRAQALAAGKSCGLRINPECSTQTHGIYDPCAPGSRLGVCAAQLEGASLEGVEGLHFHTLCEQNVDALEETLAAVEARFGKYLHQMRWLNFGGGHHITRSDYDRARLITLVQEVQARYDVQVYLEPGEAVALNAGVLVSRVIDFVEHEGVVNAILDASAACHMPDVIEMPYRPPVCNSAEAGVRAHTYRLTGPTCLAGDIIGDYSFDAPLSRGDYVVFGDMAIYSMVKNNTFNGMPLPAIYANGRQGLTLVSQFGYADFKQRLS